MSTSRFIRTFAASSLLAAAGFLGCSTTPDGNSQSSTSALTNPIEPPPPISLAPKCTIGTTAAGATTIDMYAHIGGPVSSTVKTDALAAIRASVVANQATQVSTVSWNATDPTGALMYTASVSVNGSVSTTQVTYGTTVTGVTSGTFKYDGTTLSGSIDGRAITPITPSTYKTSSGITYADGKPAPTMTANTTAINEISKLIQIADTTGAAACGNSVPFALSRLASALPNGGPTYFAPAHTTPPSTQARPGVAQGTPSSSGIATGSEAPGWATGDSNQNTPLDWETVECQSCESSCVSLGSDILTFVSGGTYLLVCEGSCFIPGSGCSKDICSVGHSCDDDQSCCGSVCCGGDQTCGNNALGACCPKAAPVGCGDVTGTYCFPAGTTCCGDLQFGCDPGFVCTNVSGVTATCCPAGQVDKSGQCCSAGLLCDGNCCGAGATSCSNGACCFGPTDAKGNCCTLGETVVNGACCAINQGCGSTCCGAGLACLNAALSQCGPPPPPASCATGKVICDNGGQNFCCFPDEHCNGSVPQCCGGAETGSEPCIIK